MKGKNKYCWAVSLATNHIKIISLSSPRRSTSILCSETSRWQICKAWSTASPNDEKKRKKHKCSGLARQSLELQNWYNSIEVEKQGVMSRAPKGWPLTSVDWDGPQEDTEKLGKVREILNWRFAEKSYTSWYATFLNPKINESHIPNFLQVKE